MERRPTGRWNRSVADIRRTDWSCVSALVNAGQKLTAMIRLATIKPRTSKVMSQKPASTAIAPRATPP